MKCKGKEALGKTAKMIDTIKNMFKNDAVTGNGEKIKTFARDVMELKGNDTKAIETDIASKQVNIFKKILGIDLSGFKRRFESGYIRHTFNKHGAKSNDARPVTEEDFALYEDIVTNPNKISKSVTDDGKPAVVYVKKYDDKVYIVEEVREKTNGQHRLVFRNMFKNSLTHPDEAIRNPKYAGDLKFIDVKGADAPDAQLNAAPRANVRNTSAPNNDIIQQTRWENQVDKFVAALGDAYAKGESAVLGKLTGGRIKNALSVKRAAKDIYEITNDFKIAQEQMNAQAKEVMDFINKSIGEEDRLALFRTLNGDAAPDELPAHMIPTYEKFRKLIDTNAQALVDAGVLKEKYKIDDYLKRYYKDYIEQRDGFTKKYFDNFKARKNLTEDERIALGMVQDAGFAIANTLKEQRVQLIKAKKSLWS